MFSEDEVSLFYKYVEKSEEKIFRRGDYRADLWLFRGHGGLFWKYSTNCVSLHYINLKNVDFFATQKIVGL